MFDTGDHKPRACCHDHVPDCNFPMCKQRQPGQKSSPDRTPTRSSSSIACLTLNLLSVLCRAGRLLMAGPPVPGGGGGRARLPHLSPSTLGPGPLPPPLPGCAMPIGGPPRPLGSIPAHHTPLSFTDWSAIQDARLRVEPDQTSSQVELRTAPAPEFWQ